MGCNLPDSVTWGSILSVQGLEGKSESAHLITQLYLFFFFLIQSLAWDIYLTAFVVHPFIPSQFPSDMCVASCSQILLYFSWYSHGKTGDKDKFCRLFHTLKEVVVESTTGVVHVQRSRDVFAPVSPQTGLQLYGKLEIYCFIILLHLPFNECLFKKQLYFSKHL